MPEKREEEIKPCPGCGKTPNLYPREIMRGDYYRCIEAFCPLTHVAASVDCWNDMYCWKELAKRDEAIREAKTALDSIGYDMLLRNDATLCRQVAIEAIKSIDVILEGLCFRGRK